eukprot:11180694-Lingulodinium_polyedra.AAC.1
MGPETSPAKPTIETCRRQFARSPVPVASGPASSIAAKCSPRHGARCRHSSDGRASVSPNTNAPKWEPTSV